MMTRGLKAVAVSAVIVLCSARLLSGGETAPADQARASDPRPGRCELETELQRGEQVSRIVVYIRNNGDEPFTFATGARGQTHGPVRSGTAFTIDDGFRIAPVESKEVRSHGSAPTVLPQLTFGYGGGTITITAPSLGGPAFRRMDPSFFVVPPKERRQYCSFAVPTIHVSGKFSHAQMALGTMDAPVGRGDARMWGTSFTEVRAEHHAAWQSKPPDNAGPRRK